jgi:hypothetical protein
VKQWIGIVVVALFVGSLLSACGSERTGSGMSSEPESPATLTAQWWISPAGSCAFTCEHMGDFPECEFEDCELTSVTRYTESGELIGTEVIESRSQRLFSRRMPIIVNSYEVVDDEHYLVIEHDQTVHYEIGDGRLTLNYGPWLSAAPEDFSSTLDRAWEEDTWMDQSY